MFLVWIRRISSLPTESGIQYFYIQHEIFLPAHGVGDANVHLAVEPPEPAQRGVDGVGSVGGCHHDHVRPGDISNIFQVSFLNQASQNQFI